MEGLRRSLLVQALVVVVLCASAFLPLLGSSGFAQTEGHRVIPGWTMAQRFAEVVGTDDSADWSRMEMFGATYSTKPPGLPVLIGASSLLLGETEFSARAPSALCMTLGALLSLVFARRWFGPEWGLAAGLTHALTPWFWAPARSAEIESLHQLGVQAACFSALTLLIGATRGARAAAIMLLGAAGLFVMAMAKGPVGLPALVGVLVAAMVVRREISPLADWRIAVMVVAGAAAAVVALAQFEPVTWFTVTGEQVGSQLWRLDRLGQIATLPFAAFLAAMPASLALVFPWGPDARLEGRSGPDADARRAHDFARGLATAWVATVVAYMALGTGNHRYAMPSAVFVPVLVGYVVRGVCIVPDGFLPLRRKIARVMLMGRGWAWVAVLAVAAAVWVPLSESQREGRSGRAAGERLAEVLPDGAVAYADALIEAVPETLLYAQRAAEREGRRVTVIWDALPMGLGDVVAAHEPIEVSVLRHDDVVDERSLNQSLINRGFLKPVHTGAVRNYSFTVYQNVGGMTPKPKDASGGTPVDP